MCEYEKENGMKLATTTGNSCKRDEERETDDLTCVGPIDIDDKLEKASEYKGCCNIFDELMDEHPEWFSNPEDVHSEWNVIDFECFKPSGYSEWNQDEVCLQQLTSVDNKQDNYNEEISIQHSSTTIHWIFNERVVVYIPSFDNPRQYDETDFFLKSPLKVHSNIRELSSLHTLVIEGTFMEPATPSWPLHNRTELATVCIRYVPCPKTHK